jgi:hypothetical protein
MSEFVVKSEEIYAGNTEDEETHQRVAFNIEYDPRDFEAIRTKDGGYIFRRKK